MKLSIHTTDGGTLNIEDFAGETVMDMLDNWEESDILTVALNDGMAYIPKRNITRIDTTD